MPVPVAKKGWPSGNLVLSAVPTEEREALLAELEPLHLRSGELLYHAGDRITHLHFPLNCAVSEVGVDRNGATAERVLIGNEGLVGLNALLGDYRASGHAIVQIPGHCYRVEAALVARAFERSAALRRFILRYVSSRVFQTSQTSLCNARHPVEQRLCRWLLQALDRGGSRDLRVTHELVGVALGLRREAVTMAAMRLQAGGAIRCARGRITVLDRAALEAAGCECYAALKQDLEVMASEASAVERPPARPR